MINLPNAEELNFWKTSSSAPDTWMMRTRKQIEGLGGTVLAEGFGSEPTSGRSAYMLAFEIAGDRYKVVWPVLPSKSRDERAARIQAATMLYHDVTQKVITARVLGARSAFFAHLMLPDGRVASSLAAPELIEVIPPLLMSG